MEQMLDCQSKKVLELSEANNGTPWQADPYKIGKFPVQIHVKQQILRMPIGHLPKTS